MKTIRNILLLLTLITKIFAQDYYVLGEYLLSKIIDGDTFKFEGLDNSARLIGIDTEETFKDKNAENKIKEISQYWNEYYMHKKDSSQKPAKIESPFGHKTVKWTEEIFREVKKFRLETDDIKNSTDMYNRYLVYVMCIKEDGSEFNYNIECVKEGRSAYFTKYGYSKRFDKEFKEAQDYAKKHKLGIWSGKELCYPDYDERILWWNARAEQIIRFEKLYSASERYFNLTNTGELERLRGFINDSVIVFCNVTRVEADKNPITAKCELSDGKSFDIVFFEPYYKLVNETGIANPKNYNIYVKGKLTEFRSTLQIIVTEKEQIWIE
jgi:endonuclease YncB( thermonuclease family)